MKITSISFLIFTSLLLFSSNAFASCEGIGGCRDVRNARANGVVSYFYQTETTMNFVLYDAKANGGFVQTTFRNIPKTGSGCDDLLGDLVTSDANAIIVYDHNGVFEPAIGATRAGGTTSSVTINGADTTRLRCGATRAN